MYFTHNVLKLGPDRLVGRFGRETEGWPVWLAYRTGLISGSQCDRDWSMVKLVNRYNPNRTGLMF